MTLLSTSRRKRVSLRARRSRASDSSRLRAATCSAIPARSAPAVCSRPCRAREARRTAARLRHRTSSSCTPNGLFRKSAAPASSRCTRVSSSALAVSMTTGMSAVSGRDLSSASTASPVMPGIITSQRITSGEWAAAIRRPSGPSAAASTRAALASDSATNRRISGLSSITSTRGRLPPAEPASTGTGSASGGRSWASVWRTVSSASGRGAGAGPGASATAGNSTRSSAPPSGAREAAMVPPCRVTNSLAIARPSPVPEYRRSASGWARR